MQPDVLGRGKGLVWFLTAGWNRTLIPERWRVSAGVDVSWANAEYMRTEFGITPAEAARTGLTAYRPSAGYKSTTARLATEYFFNPHWSLGASVELEHYGSKAEDSPLVGRFGKSTTTEAGVFLRYRF